MIALWESIHTAHAWGGTHAQFQTETRASRLPSEALKLVALGDLWSVAQLSQVILSKRRGSKGLLFIGGFLSILGGWLLILGGWL